MSWPAYPDYQVSDFEWLGAIPSHWRVVRFKYLFQEVDERNGDTPVGVMLSVSGYRGVEEKQYEDENKKRTDEELRDYRVVRPGWLAVNTMWLNYAGLGVSSLTGHMSPAYRAYIPRRSIHAQYAHHLLRSSVYVSGYTKYLQGIRPNSLQMKTEDFESFPVVLPTPEEQCQIARFLDHETARIDALIEEQQRLIDLLQEKRQAVISHAVTKGLDPDVPMNDSGVPWIGSIPEHWHVSPIKRHIKNLDFRRIPVSAEDRSYRKGDYPYYGASGIIDWIDEYIFDEETVLVAEDGANLLMRSTPIAFVARGKYWVNNHAHIIRPVDGLYEYWAALIDSIDVSLFVRGAAQPKLTSEALGELIIPLPPSWQERAEIAGQIVKADAEYEERYNAASGLMKLLRERRSALISAAVTGKIDVRGWKPQNAPVESELPRAAEPEAPYG